MPQASLITPRCPPHIARLNDHPRRHRHDRIAYSGAEVHAAMHPRAAGPAPAVWIGPKYAPRHGPIKPIMLAQRQLGRGVTAASGGDQQSGRRPLERRQRAGARGKADVRSQRGCCCARWYVSERNQRIICLSPAGTTSSQQNNEQQEQATHHGTGNSSVTSVVRPAVTSAGAANSYPPTAARTQ
jgi:hypothetical protein